MIDSEFRSLLHDRLGPALDELVAPDLLDRVRTRQVRHKRAVRAGLALSATATVAAVVAAVAVWPSGDSAGPTAPASSGTLSTPAPSPSTSVVDMSSVAPLVTSGPCAGLAVAAYEEAAGVHPPVTAITSVEVALTMGGGQLLDLKAGGPCVDRLSYVQRTSAFQNQVDVPYAFRHGLGVIVTDSSPHNQTGAVQLFLDCKGLVCGASGAPLATITVKVTGSEPGAASLPFEPLPSPLAPPTGAVLTVPSLIGLSVDAARQVLASDGFTGFGVSYAGGDGPAGLVLAEDPPVGSVVPKTGGVMLTVSGHAPAHATPPSTPRGGAAPPTSAVPSVAPPTSIAMPTVLGLSQTTAEAVLQKAGIAYVVTYALRPAPSHTITFQNPKPGVAVLSSTVVQLTVSLGPAPRQP